MCRPVRMHVLCPSPTFLTVIVSVIVISGTIKGKLLGISEQGVT